MTVSRRNGYLAGLPRESLVTRPMIPSCVEFTPVCLVGAQPFKFQTRNLYDKQQLNTVKVSCEHIFVGNASYLEPMNCAIIQNFISPNSFTSSACRPLAGVGFVRPCEALCVCPTPVYPHCFQHARELPGVVLMRTSMGQGTSSVLYSDTHYSK